MALCRWPLWLLLNIVRQPRHAYQKQQTSIKGMHAICEGKPELFFSKRAAIAGGTHARGEQVHLLKQELVAHLARGAVYGLGEERLGKYQPGCVCCRGRQRRKVLQRDVADLCRGCWLLASNRCFLATSWGLLTASWCLLDRRCGLLQQCQAQGSTWARWASA